MNLHHPRLLLSLLLLGLFACQPQDSSLSPVPTPADPSTAIGQPQGVPITQTIGPEGGTLTTPDGQVTLTLPAGALTKATPITIQPITNQAPNGIGQAYRFLPEGTQFSKPAKLTVRYQTTPIAANEADLLGVAYQAPNQHWQAVEGVVVDTTNRLLSVPMPHFSDWSAYELAKLSLIELEGGPSQLDLGASTTLQVVQSIVEPLINPAHEQLTVDAHQLKWSVVGGAVNGHIQASNEKAIYTAPTTYPLQNPVTIQLEVGFTNSPKKAYLLKRILIGQDYFRGSFGSSSFDWSELSVTKSEQYLLINGNSGAQSLNLLLRLNGSSTVLGSYGYSVETKPGTALVEYAASYGDYDGYLSFLYECDFGEKGLPPLVSGSSVSISQVEEVDGVTYVRGQLSGTLFNLPGPCPATVRRQSIQGEFRIRLAP